MQIKWIVCPRLRQWNRNNDTGKYGTPKFSLYCPKCKKETIVNVQDRKITPAVSK